MENLSRIIKLSNGVGTRAAGGSIKLGEERRNPSPKMIKPAKLAIAVSHGGFRPLRGLNCYCWLRSWGLRPRLYAVARSAGSMTVACSAGSMIPRLLRRLKTSPFAIFRRLHILFRSLNSLTIGSFKTYDTDHSPASSRTDIAQSR
jgi:hypothetical protein